MKGVGFFFFFSNAFSLSITISWFFFLHVIRKVSETD